MTMTTQFNEQITAHNIGFFIKTYGLETPLPGEYYPATSAILKNGGFSKPSIELINSCIEHVISKLAVQYLNETTVSSGPQHSEKLEIIAYAHRHNLLPKTATEEDDEISSELISKIAELKYNSGLVDKLRDQYFQKATNSRK